ncbi:MAG: 23S rRNA (uracil(1939)-C(5))-methyltransferase RlmD [Gammaproteobacteria bacterium]
MARRRKRLSRDPIEANVDSLSHEGRGVANCDGKVTFIDGALPGERVTFQLTNRRKTFDEGKVIEVLEPSNDRIKAKCQHYGICGGCSLQHLSSEDQIKHKQSVLLEQFDHIGNVSPEEVLPPLRSPLWGYRRKARLGVKYVPKKGGVLVGFREKASPYLADMTQCEILDPSVGHHLIALREVIASLTVKERLPQIEVAVGDKEKGLIFRHLDPLTEDDKLKLSQFGETHQFVIYLQPKGPDTVHQIYPETQVDLSYQPGEDEPTLHFLPSDFTQVNASINKNMIARVLGIMQPDKNDRVLDLFCGLGNFSLSIARRAGYVLGVEGEAGLVKRAEENAQRNQLENAEFVCADLTQDDQVQRIEAGKFNKVLLDPARSGAQEIIEKMSFSGVEQVIYVSCNPATLARDVGILVNEKGYKMIKAGIMDMFPHTTHVESIAVFQRVKKA